MPVGMLFSIARRKLVSCTSAPWIWLRRLMWRQVPSSIHTVSTESATTIQNSVLLTRPMLVRQPWPRSSRPLSAGVSGASLTMAARRLASPGIGVTVAASSFWFSSTIEIMWRCATSAGTKCRTSESTEYSTTSTPVKLFRSTSGRCSWKAAAPVLSVKPRE